MAIGTGFRSKLRRVELFAATVDVKGLKSQNEHYKGAVGNVLTLNSRITHELDKVNPDFMQVWQDVQDASLTIDNIEVYKTIIDK